MKTKKFYKVIATLIMITLIAILTFQSFAVTNSEVDALKEKADATKNELNEVTENKATAETELDSLNSQLEDVQTKIADLKSQLSEVNDKITQKQVDIDKEAKEIDDKTELLKNRMVALYEAGDTSYLDVLLNSNDIIDFVSGYSAIQTIAQADTDLINELEDKKTQLEKDKSELETDKQKVEDLKNEQEINNATLVDLQQKKQTQVNSLSDEEKQKQATLDEYTKQITAAEAQIKKDAEEAKKRAEANQNSSSSSSSGSINNSSGTLGWPLPSKYEYYSYITSYFGPRVQPTAGASTNHGAIDIGVPMSTPVYAAESGQVLIASWYGGYGNFIMIWHNGVGELYTCYGHLSKYCVSSGDYVSRGQQIAYSGSTGVSTGPHLHFEVRSGGESSSNRVNPLNYVIIN